MEGQFYGWLRCETSKAFVRRFVAKKKAEGNKQV
jgi:hypothetical protein